VLCSHAQGSLTLLIFHLHQSIDPLNKHRYNLLLLVTNAKLCKSGIQSFIIIHTVASACRPDLAA